MKELKLNECEEVVGGFQDAPWSYPTPGYGTGDAAYSNFGTQQTQAQLTGLATKIGAGQVH